LARADEDFDRRVEKQRHIGRPSVHHAMVACDSFPTMTSDYDSWTLPCYASLLGQKRSGCNHPRGFPSGLALALRTGETDGDIEYRITQLILHLSDAGTFRTRYDLLGTFDDDFGPHPATALGEAARQLESKASAGGIDKQTAELFR